MENLLLLTICLILGILIGVAVGYLLYKDPYCCGPGTSRRIDVAYPPGIRIGLTGPWTKTTDRLDRRVFDGILD